MPSSARKSQAKSKNPCWPGYEPVKGKRPYSQGSCRPKAESKLSPSEKEFRTKRAEQLDDWDSKHPKTRRSAAQHLRAPATAPKRAPKKSSTQPGATSKVTARGKKSKTSG